MRAFKLHLRTEYIFGSGRFSEAGRTISGYGRRILIVCGGSARRNGTLAELQAMCDDLDIRSFVYDKIRANPLVSTVDEGGQLAANSRVDLVVALGGGSVMDAAKGIAIVARNGGSIWDYVFFNKTVQESLPVLTIPTLSATGSESNAYGVVTHDKTKEKAGFICKGALPLAALIDPRLTLSVPPDYLRDGAVDVIAHSIEAFISSRDRAPLNDNISLALIRTVVETLPEMLKDPENEDHRAVFAWTSTLALNGINDSGREGPYTMHALEHPMSGLFNISHGLGLAVLMPAYLQYFAEEKSDKIRALGKYVFDLHSPGVEDSLQALNDWLASIDRLVSLEDAGIPGEAVPQLVEQVFRLNANRHAKISGPRELSIQDVENIYKRCLKRNMQSAE